MENEDSMHEEERTPGGQTDLWSMLPEPIRSFADDGVKWVRSHPTEAFVLGAVGGFAVGALGIGRALVAARFLRSVPQVLPGLVAGATALAGRLDPDSDERVTH